MNKRILILGYLILTINLVSFSQVNARLNSMIRNSSLYVDNPYEKVVGNPYIEKEFLEGKMVFKDSSEISEVLLRLNHNTDQIEFMEGDEIRGFSKPQDLEFANFGNRSFIYVRYFLSKKVMYGYFEVLANGYCKLLYRRESIIKREQLPPSEMSGGNYRDYFRTTEDYYLLVASEPAKKIVKSKKSVLKTINNQETELNKYIIENGLKLKQEESLIKLINYYNSLKQ